jgi:hypothetical protein
MIRAWSLDVLPWRPTTRDETLEANHKGEDFIYLK